MSGTDARALARQLFDLCRMRKLTVTTAESCTGGLVAATLTDIPGSSAVFDRGFITYSNEAKRKMLGVSATTLETFGAVSEQTATAMAVAALEKADCGLAVAVTGIAGPGGATPGKPIGLVHFAGASRDGRIVQRACKFGAVGRAKVRERSVIEALKLLLELARGPGPVKRAQGPSRTTRPRVSRKPRRSGGTRRRTSRP